MVFATSEEGGGIVDVRENGASDESKRFDGIFIKAINPGYTVDGKSNVGEMIEITKTRFTQNNENKNKKSPSYFRRRSRCGWLIYSSICDV